MEIIDIIIYICLVGLLINMWMTDSLAKDIEKLQNEQNKNKNQKVPRYL